MISFNIKKGRRDGSSGWLGPLDPMNRGTTSGTNSTMGDPWIQCHVSGSNGSNGTNGTQDREGGEFFLYLEAQWGPLGFYWKGSDVLEGSTTKIEDVHRFQVYIYYIYIYFFFGFPAGIFFLKSGVFFSWCVSKN